MANIQHKTLNASVETAATYLELNNFLRNNKSYTGTEFIKEDKLVLIYGDKVSFRQFDPENDHDEFIEYASFEGIDLLSESDWMFLFHITKVIPVKSFIKELKLVNTGSNANVHPLFRNLLKTAFAMVTILGMFTSCSPQVKLWEAKGHAVPDKNGVYHFEKYGDWYLKDMTKPFPDTIISYSNSYKKPKS